MSAIASVTIIETLVHMHCGNCEANYGLTQSFIDRARKDGTSWTCPHCEQTRVFRESENDRLKKQLAQTQTTLERSEANVKWWQERKQLAQQEAAHQEARARGYKGALSKVEKRIRAGVCPCCNRTFKDLLQHMQTQHPAEIPSTHLAKP